MSERWWESDRSKLAASVRSTRRRLRAGFRGSVSKAVAIAAGRIEEAARVRVRDAEARAAQADKRAADVVSGVSRVVIRSFNYHLSRRLVADITLDERVLTAANEEALRAEIGKVLGREVERAVANYRLNTNQEAVR